MRRTKWVILALTLAVLLTVAMAPAASAQRACTPVFAPAAGEWTWIGDEDSVKVVDLQNGDSYLTGFEVGTWTGTFDGTAYEPFEAMFVGSYRPVGDAHHQLPW